MVKVNSTKEPTMAKVNIGELLSGKRAEKNLTIMTVANKTKLSIDSIELLESNQFSKIGTPVYVRGYLGIYAKLLGLNVANLIQLYNTQHPAKEVEIKPSISPKTGRKKIKRHSKTLSAFLSILTFMGLSYAYSRIEPWVFGNEPSQPITKPIRAEGVGESPIDTAILASQKAKGLAEDVLNGLPVAGNHKPMDSAAFEQALVADSAAALSSGSLSRDNSLSEASDLPTLTLESASALTSDEPITPSKEQHEEITLDLQFANECWLKITDQAGDVLATGLYNRKNSLSLQGDGPLILTTWRPEAISAVILNGSPIKLTQYQTGKKTYRLDKK